MKQKYIKIAPYGEIIIFPCSIEHSVFKGMGAVTAGFCYIDADKVRCFGKSISLKLESNPKVDSDLATKQLFGYF